MVQRSRLESSRAPVTMTLYCYAVAIALPLATTSGSGTGTNAHELELGWRSLDLVCCGHCDVALLQLWFHGAR